MQQSPFGELIDAYLRNALPALGGKSYAPTSKWNILLDAHISLDSLRKR